MTNKTKNNKLFNTTYKQKWLIQIKKPTQKSSEWVRYVFETNNYFVSAGLASAVLALSLQQDFFSPDFASIEQDLPAAAVLSLQQDLPSFLHSFFPLSLSSSPVDLTTDAETLPTNPAKANIKNTFFMVELDFKIYITNVLNYK
jgi:hypothetical protein